MHIRLVLRVTALLLTIISSFMIFPIIIAIIYHEQSMIQYFAIPMILTCVIAIAVIISTRNSGRVLSNKDGFLLVSLSWITAAFVGALPFRISGIIPSFADAYFETMSGFTTTGASILTQIEGLPYSMLFWRSLTHWLGGMGIVVLTIAVFPLLGIGALQLMKAESPGPTLDKLTPKVTETAKILWFLYIGLSALETLLLLFGGMNLFDSLTHTFGTLATGGFSPKNASVGSYGSAYIDIVITIFMMLAGMNFVLFFRFITGKFRKVFNNTELRAYFGIFFIAVAIITSDLYANGIYSTIGTSARFAAFQAASIITTTGFATTDFALWPQLAQTVLVILMFIGGCAGSTGGGIKVVRYVTLFKLSLNEMKLFAHPRGVFSIRMGEETVSKETVNSISGFFFLYILMLLATMLVVAMGGHDIVTSLTTSLATVGNIGPGFGLVGPAQNYAFFSDGIKWFLSFAMMVGRLEVYTVLILLTPNFWRR